LSRFSFTNTVIQLSTINKLNWPGLGRPPTFFNHPSNKFVNAFKTGQHLTALRTRYGPTWLIIMSPRTSEARTHLYKPTKHTLNVTLQDEWHLGTSFRFRNGYLRLLFWWPDSLGTKPGSKYRQLPGSAHDANKASGFIDITFDFKCLMCIASR
jgi:hypothetical protein